MVDLCAGKLDPKRSWCEGGNEKLLVELVQVPAQLMHAHVILCLHGGDDNGKRWGVQFATARPVVEKANFKCVAVQQRGAEDAAGCRHGAVLAAQPATERKQMHRDVALERLLDRRSNVPISRDNGKGHVLLLLREGERCLEGNLDAEGLVHLLFVVGAALAPLKHVHVEAEARSLVKHAARVRAPGHKEVRAILFDWADLPLHKDKQLLQVDSEPHVL